ncbi:MAG: hypothetical protein CMI58_01895 [Parcubacteria group bacterium]|nr:hypothetical protein [Parcubacteria group bacterium]
MINVLLINPPDYKMIQGAIPKELGSDRMGKYPPLGLLYIASYAQTRYPAILNINIVDAITDSLTHEEIHRIIEEFQPDIIGISVYTFTLIDSLQVARSAKKIIPHVPVVFGGFHPTIYPKETLLCSPDVDIVVAGEAEEAFSAVIGRILNMQSLEGLPGVSFKKLNGDIHIDKQTQFVTDLNALPFPDRRMVNYKHHSCILGATGLTTNILSSRGCPYRCRYCYVNIREYRVRSLDNIFAEIHNCLSLDINEFFFVDDLFNLSKRRVIGFSERVIDEGLDIRWSFRGRVDQIDDETLEKAKKAGCTRIHFGIESGVPKILKRVGKGTNLEMVRNTLSLTRQFGIEVSSSIMIGLPGESPRETDETIRFVLSLSTDYIQAAVFTPYPKTAFYEEGLRSSLLPNDYWSDFALHPVENFEPYIWGEFYTKDQLFDKLREIYRRFYLRPRFILSYVKHLTSLKAITKLAKNFQTFLSLITKRRIKD